MSFEALAADIGRAFDALKIEQANCDPRSVGAARAQITAADLLLRRLKREVWKPVRDVSRRRIEREQVRAKPAVKKRIGFKPPRREQGRKGSGRYTKPYVTSHAD